MNTVWDRFLKQQLLKSAYSFYKVNLFYFVVTLEHAALQRIVSLLRQSKTTKRRCVSLFEAEEILAFG